MDEVENNKFLEAEAAGYFSGVIGKAQLQGVFNDSIFADQIIETDGKIYYRFVQRYSDGTFSGEIVVPQSGISKMIIVEDDSIPENAKRPLRTAANRFINQITDEYFGKIRADETLPIFSILSALHYFSKNLPKCHPNHSSITPRKLYSMIVDIINKDYSYIMDYAKKSYYILSDVEITNIADKLDMTVKQLCEYLAKFKLLYLTDTSSGYKTKVRVSNTDIDRYYCLLRLDNAKCAD